MSSETTEQEHVHVCPVCADSWLHADTECREPETPLPMAWVRRTPLPMAWVRRAWARCPKHEGEEL
jgi:hypothetical protein